MQSIIHCHYYYYSLTYKTVITSIAHVMKKQEVKVTSAHAQHFLPPGVTCMTGLSHNPFTWGPL